jgi:urease subunit beta
MSTNTKGAPVGGLVLASGDIEINAGYPTTTLKVRNTGDRPIQVGSHFHFFEANSSLEFDRGQAFGKRLNIPATTALRFEPGDEKEVTLIPFLGKKRVLGFNSLVNGWVGDESHNGYRPRLTDAMELVTKYGFKNKP